MAPWSQLKGLSDDRPSAALPSAGTGAEDWVSLHSCAWVQHITVLWNAWWEVLTARSWAEFGPQVDTFYLTYTMF